MIPRKIKEYLVLTPYFRLIKSLSPYNNFNALGNIALVLAAQHKNANAIEYFEKVMNIDPNNASARNNLGWIYLESGKLQEALECFNQAIRIAPEKSHYLNNKAIVLEKLGRKKDAEIYRQKAVEVKHKALESIEKKDIRFDIKIISKKVPIGFKLNADSNGNPNSIEIWCSCGHLRIILPIVSENESISKSPIEIHCKICNAQAEVKLPFKKKYG